MLACTIISLVLFCIYTYDEVDPMQLCSSRDLIAVLLTVSDTTPTTGCGDWAASLPQLCQLVNHISYGPQFSAFQQYKNTTTQNHSYFSYIQPTQSRLHMLFCLVFSCVYWLKSRVLLHCNVSVQWRKGRGRGRHKSKWYIDWRMNISNQQVMGEPK